MSKPVLSQVPCHNTYIGRDHHLQDNMAPCQSTNGDTLIAVVEVFVIDDHSYRKTLNDKSRHAEYLLHDIHHSQCRIVGNQGKLYIVAT